MKISVTFESDEERFKVLSMISLTMTKPVTELSDVEASLIKYLEETVKVAFTAGGLKKVQLDNEASIKEVSNSLFKSEP